MKTKLLLIEVAFLITLTFLLPAFSFSQGTWTQKADFAGGLRSAANGLSIGTKGYIGMGGPSFPYYLDFWEWDPATNIWTRKADLPGNMTLKSVCFSIGTKGYILSGTGFDGTTYSQELWEYDAEANSWAQKASIPTGTPARESAIGFSIGTKGYIGIGHKIDSSGAGAYFKDFWEYDQATNTWTQKADFMGVASSGAVGFSIGNKGYIGTGSNQSIYSGTSEFWEWDQATNVWTQKSDFGGTARVGAVGFSIGNKGYIGTGEYGAFNDLWEWDQSNDIWTKKTDLKGIGRANAVGFSIGNKGYIGTGFYTDNDENIFNLQDFWEFDPLETTGIGALSKENSSIFPNPASDIINFNFNNKNNADVELDIYNVTGELIKSEVLKPDQHQINVADLRNGIYLVEVKTNSMTKNQKLIIRR